MQSRTLRRTQRRARGPRGIAIAAGKVYVASSTNGAIDRFNEAGEYQSTFGKRGTGAGQLESPFGVGIDSKGNVWVAEVNSDRVSEYSSSGSFIKAIGYGVENGEAKFETCTTTCRAGTAGNGPGQFNLPKGLTVIGSTIYVADYQNARIEKFSEAGAYLGSFGTRGTAEGDMEGPTYLAADPASSSGLFVTDKASNRVDEFSTTGTFRYEFGTLGTGPGQLQGPSGVAIAGNATAYIMDKLNNRVSVWLPGSTITTGNVGAHSIKTFYYTAGANEADKACGLHPEWVGLLCQSTPAEQPGTLGSLELPVVTTEYNTMDQAANIKEAFGAAIREKKTTFGSGGRPETTEETAPTDKAIPKITDKYNSNNGTIAEQISTAGESSKSVKGVYNTLGQLESYTDAEGDITAYKYDIDGRVTSVSDQTGEGEGPKEEGRGRQKYGYNTTTGALATLEDSAAGKFTATYDTEGRLTTENYPNGMAAYYTYDAGGATTGIKYKKETYCTEEKESCVWYSDVITPSIHGETLAQNSSLSREPNYTYDAAGRLTGVEETPTGEGCKTRQYSYDEEGNRILMTNREPASEGKCATEGGTTEYHTYDTANHLTDTEVTYDTFGNITHLPAADAGQAALTTTYYLDNQVYTQEQSGEKLEYTLDPEDRTLQTISKGTTNSNLTAHYDGPGAGPAWTSEASTSTWTRNIAGIDGTLTAIQTDTTAPVLQLHDLHGDVIATAALSEKETKLLTKYNSTEFGVPTSKATPPPYAWLGASGLSTALPSGTITQDGNSYVPQTAHTLQTEAVNLPLPINQIPMFTDGEAPLTAEGGVREASTRFSEWLKAQEAVAAAPTPPGTSPVVGAGGRGCVGYACAALVYSGVTDYGEHGTNGYGCRVWGSWGAGEVLASEIAGFGHWSCGAAVPAFEMQIEAYGWGASEFEGYEVMLGKPGRAHFITEYWKGRRGGEFNHTWMCPATGSWYHLWFWGRQLGTHGATQWSAAGWEARTGSCTNRGPVDITPVAQAGEPS